MESNTSIPSADMQEANQNSEVIQSIVNQFPEEYAENPRLVTLMAKICLAYRQDDGALAVERLGNYLHWRKKAFGDLRDQHLREQTKLCEQLRSTFLQLSPVRLSGGVGLVCLTMKLHDASKYSATETMKCMHFFVITALMEDPLLASSGFAFINNTTDAGRHNIDISLPSVLVSSIIRCLPYRINKILLINPPWIIRMFIPIVRAVLPAKLAARLHVAPAIDEIAEIVGALDQKDLPTTLGGTVEFDTLQHIDRLLQQDWVV